MIHVVAIITTKPGARVEVLAAFAEIVPLVHAEEGCVEYQPVTDVPDAGDVQSALGEDSFMVIEKWSTLDNLKAHAVSPHMVDYGKKVGHLLVDRRIHILN